MLIYFIGRMPSCIVTISHNLILVTREEVLKISPHESDKIESAKCRNLDPNQIKMCELYG